MGVSITRALALAAAGDMSTHTQTHWDGNLSRARIGVFSSFSAQFEGCL